MSRGRKQRRGEANMRKETQTICRPDVENGEDLG